MCVLYIYVCACVSVCYIMTSPRHLQVQIQPHSVDFYEAVRQSGMEVQLLLTESLARFSCLTEASGPDPGLGWAGAVRTVELMK